MVQKYILTGGPGSGKSSILLELERHGEYIIREAAEDWIKLQQAKGINEPWLKSDFQKKILEIQVQRESGTPENVERIFVDRGIPDGMAYAEPGTRLYEEIQGQVRKYNGVFLIKSLQDVDTNIIRREDYGKAQILSEKLEKIYTNLGYRVEKIDIGPVEERANRILDILNGVKGGEEEWKTNLEKPTRTFEK